MGVSAKNIFVSFTLHFLVNICSGKNRFLFDLQVFHYPCSMPLCSHLQISEIALCNDSWWEHFKLCLNTCQKRDLLSLLGPCECLKFVNMKQKYNNPNLLSRCMGKQFRNHFWYKFWRCTKRECSLHVHSLEKMKVWI